MSLVKITQSDILGSSPWTLKCCIGKYSGPGSRMYMLQCEYSKMRLNWGQNSSSTTAGPPNCTEYYEITARPFTAKALYNTYILCTDLREYMEARLKRITLLQLRKVKSEIHPETYKSTVERLKRQCRESGRCLGRESVGMMQVFRLGEGWQYHDDEMLAWCQEWERFR